MQDSAESNCLGSIVCDVGLYDGRGALGLEKGEGREQAMRLFTLGRDGMVGKEGVGRDGFH